MSGLLNRLLSGRSNAPEDRKGQTLFAITDMGGGQWGRRSYASLSREGYQRNPVVYRCVRLIAESASRVPLVMKEGGRRSEGHPVLDVLKAASPPE